MSLPFFALPGIMRPESPIANAETLAAPDGSWEYDFESIPQGEAAPVLVSLQQVAVDAQVLADIGGLDLGGLSLLKSRPVGDYTVYSIKTPSPPTDGRLIAYRGDTIFVLRWTTGGAPWEKRFVIRQKANPPPILP